MAVDPNVNKTIQDTAKIVEDVSANVSSQISDLFNQTLNDTLNYADSVQKGILRGIKSISENYKVLEQNENKLTRGTLTRADIQKQIEARANKIKALESEMGAAFGKNSKRYQEINEELQEAVTLNEAIVAKLKEQGKQAAEIEKKIGNTGKLLQKVSKIPVLGNLIDAEETLERVQKEAARAGSTSASVMNVAFNSLGKTLKTSLLNPLTAIGLSIDFLQKAVKYALEFNETQIKTSKALLISAKSAKSLTESFQDLAKESNNAYINYTKLSEANIELNDVLGTNVKLTAKQLEDNIQLKEVAGLEADERAAIYKLSILTGQTQEKIFDSIGKQNKGVLSNKKVLSEVLKTSGQLAAQYKNNPVLLAQAVIQAQHLGTTLEKTKQISSQLLNFEDSISAELEAELLTGQDLNLEKARYLALQGDSAGAAKELLANMGPNGLVKFQKMNVIQQESLARALGMGVDELADTLVKQDQLSKLTVAQRKENEKNVKLAEMERTEREKTAQNIENLKKTFFSLTNGPIATIMKGFNNMLEGINNSPWIKEKIGQFGAIAGIGAVALGLISSIRLLSGIFSKGAIPVYIKGMANSGSNLIEDIISPPTRAPKGNKRYINPKTGKPFQPGSMLPKNFARNKALKSLKGSKALKVGGGLVSLAGGLALDYASEKAMESGNENLGKGLDIGSSALEGAALGGTIGSIIPGVGTAIGAGVGGLLGAGYGAYKNYMAEPEQVQDALIRPGQRPIKFAKGDIITAGTNLGSSSNNNETNDLLKELINTIKQGGNVYLDGNKVGTSMSVGTYRTQ